MEDAAWLTDRFEERRSRLRAVAYRMLGSVSEADDALQETWLRIGRADAAEVENLDGWLTTIVARVCLNILRTRRRRLEEPLDLHVPDPVLSPASGMDPEQEALLADSVGLAMLVVLESLSPAERLAFVLHDMFGVPFDAIAPLVERTPTAARQLASRARRRVRGQAPEPDPDPALQREVVDAYLAAVREGDFDALVAVLHPDVVLRADGGSGRRGAVLHGADEVASQAVLSSQLVPFAHAALVNGAAGIVAILDSKVVSVMGFTVTDGMIAAIDVLMDPDRLATLDVTFLDK